MASIVIAGGCNELCSTCFLYWQLHCFSLPEFSTFAVANDCDRSAAMHWGDAILLGICILLCGYLLYALLKAEEF